MASRNIYLGIIFRVHISGRGSFILRLVGFWIEVVCFGWNGPIDGFWYGRRIDPLSEQDKPTDRFLF